MNKRLKLIEKVTAFASIFLLPTQLALHFWPAFSFVFGIRVDFLSIAIYISDLLIFGLFILLLINGRQNFFKFIARNKFYFCSILMLSLINISFSTLPYESLYKWTKIWEAMFFGVYVYLRKDFLKIPNILYTLFVSTVIFSLIGISQVFIGGTTGILYILGERSFKIFTPGIALFVLTGRKILRAYSTFPHPNALAGYLGVSILLFLNQNFLKRNKLFLLGLLLISFCFILTFSLTAYIAVGTLIIFVFLKNIKLFSSVLIKNIFLILLTLSLLFPVYSQEFLVGTNLPPNISQRIDLSLISGYMINEKTITGEGLGTFIYNSIRFRTANSYIWLLQPVHNIFLLTFSETGVLGLLVLSYSIFKLVVFAAKTKNFYLEALIFFVLLTGISDHYWITIQQDLLILPLALGLLISF